MSFRNGYPQSEGKCAAMNPAITVALLIAAQEEETGKHIIARLRQGKATGPSTAIALNDLDSDKQDLLREAVVEGSVATTADGRFYLNERMIVDREDGQAFVALVIIIIGLSVIASGVALFVLVTR